MVIKQTVNKENGITRKYGYVNQVNFKNIFLLPFRGHRKFLLARFMHASKRASIFLRLSRKRFFEILLFIEVVMGIIYISFFTSFNTFRWSYPLDKKMKELPSIPF